MKRIIALLKVWAQKLRKYISPVFLALFAVSFTLWYISKLNYTYTTDFEIDVKIDNKRIDVPCVVEGKGTTLFGYALYVSRSTSIPLTELKYDTIPVFDDTDTVVIKRLAHITPASMQDALSVRFSDLKIISVGKVEDIELPKQ
ncbi:MAG: hypothetical protein IKL20_02805 [Alistipes sp.]|nr:hypothetical protein [Alistipes sp.]